MRGKQLLPLLLLTVIIMTSGCFPKEKIYTPTEAEKKLAAFCIKEGNLKVITKRLGLTLWIYVPVEDPIFEVKASPDTGKTERKIQPFSLLSLEAEFSEKYFKLNYDVVPDVLAGEPMSYGSNYNEAYTKKRQLMYQALQESFFNAKGGAQDPAPQFVVIMIADITKGIATKSMLYLRDLRQYVTEVLPPTEYYMREANEIIGKQDLIEDKTGKNAPYAEVTWPYFLTEQIKTRIKYKFSGIDLPDDTVPATEIAKAAANTLRFYPFGDYTGVLLYDVRSKKELDLTKDLLKGYAEKSDWETEDRKLTTIHFQLPQDPTAGVVVNSITTTTTEEKPLPQ
jgi:hypothetical protein